MRELARRLKIHHNTVSGAYQDLVKMEWVAGTAAAGWWSFREIG